MSHDDEVIPPEVLAYLRRHGSRIGKKYGALGAAITNAKLTTATRRKAGRKAADALTPEQRKERAAKAAAARWGKKNPDGSEHA